MRVSIGILIGVILLLISSINTLQTNVGWMNLTLNKIAKQVGVSEPSIDNGFIVYL